MNERMDRWMDGWQNERKKYYYTATKSHKCLSLDGGGNFIPLTAYCSINHYKE